MVLRVVIFGPGRVGTAIGRRLRQSGADLLGFVGRDPVRAAAACATAGGGAVLPAAAHARAHVVVFAVGDGDLATAIGQAMAAAPPRRCSLWLHTSGRHGLEPFAAVPGVRAAALHPVAPFAAAATDPLPGAPGVWLAGPDAQRLVLGLCQRLGLAPIAAHAGDRLTYHAACALAANGLTGLFAAATSTLTASGVVAASAAPILVQALMRAAIDGCGTHGPAAALSGPVRRGDAATVEAHLAALRQHAPGALLVYLATARQALDLAAPFLPAGAQAAIRRPLEAALAALGAPAGPPR